MLQLARSKLPWIAGFAQDARDFLRIFVTWWFGELRGVVPARLRQMLGEGEPEFLVRLHADMVQIEGRPNARQSWDLPLRDGAGLPSALQSQLRGGAILMLPAESVLRRTVELPQAASSELYTATSFLIERLTPFRSEQAYHAARLIDRDRARKLVRAELAVISRQKLDALLAVLTAYQIPISAVRIEGDTSRPPLDLMPRQGSKSRLRWKAKEAWRPVLAAGLALMVMGPLAVAYRTHVHANALSVEAVEGASAGRRVAALRTELEARAAAEAFMPKRQRWPRAIELLDALTRTLPEDTWVFALELRPGVAVLAGFSSDVPALLEKLTVAPFTAPELTSPVVHGLASGKSRFEVRVQLRSSEP